MAIGVLPWDDASVRTELKVGNSADLVAFGKKPDASANPVRARRSIQDVVNDAGRYRETLHIGREPSQ